MRRWLAAAAVLSCSGMVCASEVHRCLDASGGLVFQDAPCGSRGPGLTDQPGVAAPRRRVPPIWIGPRPIREGECMSISPVMPLLWPEADGTRVPLPEVDGGLRLQLRADDGAIAFAVLLRARRLDLPPTPPAVSPVWPPEAMGPPPPAARAPADPARLVLSPRMDAHVLIIDGGPRLTVDNRRSPWALSFGERRSLEIRRAIQKGGALRLQVDIEGYGIVGSAALETGTLSEAIAATLACSRG